MIYQQETVGIILCHLWFALYIRETMKYQLIKISASITACLQIQAVISIIITLWAVNKAVTGFYS